MIEIGTRRFRDALGISRVIDPWWGVHIWWWDGRSAIRDYGVKIGPVEVTWYRCRGQWGWSCKLVGTRESSMIDDCF